jgi:NAD(P)-dependent dehydrogenase (short-subunit alcohol dehydrogenase family)
MRDKQLALVTGASTGIGLELAKCAAEAGLAARISVPALVNALSDPVATAHVSTGRGSVGAL